MTKKGGKMGIKQLKDPSAVIKAIEEFDELGRERFLTLHGFGKARRYFLVYGEREYDSKAIAGVAFGKQPGQHRTLRSSDFCGGENTVVKVLQDLGFNVIDKFNQTHKHG